MTGSDDDKPIRIALACVQNAGRSQMATAFARRECDRRGLDDRVEIHTGGTRPAEAVHDVVLEVMAEAGFDLSDRTPREIDPETLSAADYVATMGCSTLEIDHGSDVDVRDWALADPHDADIETARGIRETVSDRVEVLFDEIERECDVDGV